ncbi:MAG: hypothetical protein J5509_04860 [Lachnospiraceae bacterium]|nr:hypothetical protein [Lachnospiraceae bacterium]
MAERKAHNLMKIAPATFEYIKELDPAYRMVLEALVEPVREGVSFQKIMMASRTM